MTEPALDPRLTVIGVDGPPRPVTIERYGHETHRQTLGRTVTDIALEVHHVERRSGRRLDRLGGHAQAIELEGHRRGRWIFREETFAVDPFDVLAYVGDATGAEAVALSEEFLHRIASNYTPPEETR